MSKGQDFMLGMKWAALAACVMSWCAVPAIAGPEVLPDDVIPSHYDLYVAPDAQAMTTQGRVVIAIDVKRATADVVLNSEGLAFERVTLDGTRNGTASFDGRLGRA
ncbi:MAG: hypothetical protein ACREHV_11255, partial [Rhizomicrobium sp.]